MELPSITRCIIKKLDCQCLVIWGAYESAHCYTAFMKFENLIVRKTNGELLHPRSKKLILGHLTIIGVVVVFHLYASDRLHLRNFFGNSIRSVHYAL